MDLAWKVHRILEEEHLLKPGDNIVVAVSGGPDSTALLQLLFLLSGRWGWTLTAAHANHGFRPLESEQEADFIRAFAEERNIPFVYQMLDVPSSLKARGGNPQEVARELRYKFLLKTAAARGAGSIALAHHADDQAETILMRILRGTGISGLAGIPNRRIEQNVELIRPLLRITKNEIIDDLQRQGIGYCADSSNKQTKYTRNKLRLEALPFLAQYNPSVADALNRLSVLASADDDYMEEESKRAVERIAIRTKDEVRFDRQAFAGLHVALQRRFLKLILNYVFPEAESHHFTEVEQLRDRLLQQGKPNAKFRIADGIRLIREYDLISLERFTNGSERMSYIYTTDGAAGEIWIPEASCRLVYRTVRSEEAERGSNQHIACFDAGELHFPITVRNRREGDRMQPDGLNGSKKVKDIFIDHKVPAAERERRPVVTDRNGTLLWIPGIRRSGLAKITDSTQQVLCLYHMPT